MMVQDLNKSGVIERVIKFELRRNRSKILKNSLYYSPQVSSASNHTSVGSFYYPVRGIPQAKYIIHFHPKYKKNNKINIAQNATTKKAAIKAIF